MLPSLPSYFFWTFCLLVREVYRVFSTEFFWRCDSRVTEFLSSIVSHFFFFGGGGFLPGFFFFLGGGVFTEFFFCFSVPSFSFLLMLVSFFLVIFLG